MLIPIAAMLNFKSLQISKAPMDMTTIVNLLRVFVDNKNQQYYGVFEKFVQIRNISPFPAMD